MFPHQKLDWTLSRLEQQLAAHPDDVASRADLAWSALSRAMWHDGGEPWFNKALTHARRVLHDDPTHARALVVAGAALVGLDRVEPALQYLDLCQRTDPDLAELHLALGAMHAARGERHQAVREYELASRSAPDAWEPHAALGLLLRQRAPELGPPTRSLERAQFHLVRALQLRPSPAYEQRMTYELSVACLQTGRVAEATRLLTRLVEHPQWQARARYHLGIASMQLGKYKNAVLHLRQHLQEHGESPHVYARIAVCYLHLGESARARECCHQALALDPANLDARWTLGCAYVEEGRTDEGIRIFREILRDSPQYMPAFIEILKLRRTARDAGWVTGALRAEVGVYDRLPALAEGEDQQPIRPRDTTRERIRLLLDALDEVAEDPARTLLDAMNLTTDEPLRALLWDRALDALARAHASEVAGWLTQPGRWFGVDRSAQVLALAPFLPEPALARGLHLSEEDLQRAAVDRNGPAHDVLTHRRRVEVERQQARTWQAVLLLSLAVRGTEGARNLLVRWAAEADPELAIAARTGLALLGDPHARAMLEQQLIEPPARAALRELLALSEPLAEPSPYRPVSDDEIRTCATCGRRTGEVDHMMVRGDLAICDRCLSHVAAHRHELAVEDPRLRCAMTGRSITETRELYLYNGVPLSTEVVDRSLGLLEREEVDRFLAHA
jgi:tetratricopeptide (TPR) repeat protein